MKSVPLRLKFLEHEATDGVIWYNVSITDVNAQKATWFLKIRYSQILVLHKQIKDNYEGALPDFPPKKLFGNLDPIFVSQRKKHLENYFNTLLRTINIEKVIVLRDFLLQGKKDDVTSKENLEKPVKNSKIKKSKGADLINEPLQTSLLKATGGNIEKIVDFFSKKMVDTMINSAFPEEEEVLKMKKIYEKMFGQGIKMKSSLFERYTLPNGDEKNLIGIKKVSWCTGNCQTVKIMEDSIHRICGNYENMEEFIKTSPLLIHQIQ